MTTELAQRPADVAHIMERVIAAGDLAKLSAADRNTFYLQTCHSLGLNPLTRPFEYIELNRKLTLYARKDATDQLRSLRGVSVQITSREHINDLYIVTARASLPDGRCDEEIGAVPIKGLSGDALANALMKASTKAKRRVTLSICGLGFLDESELETIQELHQQEHVAPSPLPEPPRPVNRLAKMRDRYAALVEEAKTLDVPFYDLTDDADEETITRLGLELKESISEARAEDAR
jgi:hypothetical protein